MAQLTVPAEIRTLVAMKPEVSAGVDVFGGTITSADILQADPTSVRFTPDPNEIPNTMTGGLRGRALSGIGAHTARLDFSMWFRGRGVAYAAGTRPFIDLPLRACGLSSTVDTTGGAEKVTYAPTDTLENMTVYVMTEVPGGNAWTARMTGCLGTFSYAGASGQILRFDFTIFGAYTRADTAYVAPSVAQTPQYPTLKSAAFQIGAANYAPCIANVGFALGAEVVQVPCINAASGVAGFTINNRDPRLTIDPDAARDADSGFWDAISGVTASQDCTFQVGTVQYNRLLINFSAVQLLPQNLIARGGIRALQSTLVAIINTGNDDFSLVAS